MLFDIEELITKQERDLLIEHVKHYNLNLLVISDWFTKKSFLKLCKNSASFKICQRAQQSTTNDTKSTLINKQSITVKLPRYNLKTHSPLLPNNLFSINQVLREFDVEIAYASVSASFNFDKDSVIFDRGTFLSKYPKETLILQEPCKKDQVSDSGPFFNFRTNKFAVLGLIYPPTIFSNILTNQGKIGFFGDSSCFENSSQGQCLGVLDLFVKFLRK